MTVLLVGTLSFALLHTLAWLVRLWLTRDQWKKHKELAHADGVKLYRRFDRQQRTMHLMMLLSFFTLALTGMALKFSYMGVGPSSCPGCSGAFARWARCIAWVPWCSRWSCWFTSRRMGEEAREEDELVRGVAGP